jgi:hypothetical protein
MRKFLTIECLESKFLLSNSVQPIYQYPIPDLGVSPPLVLPTTPPPGINDPLIPLPPLDPAPDPVQPQLPDKSDIIGPAPTPLPPN